MTIIHEVGHRENDPRVRAQLEALPELAVYQAANAASAEASRAAVNASRALLAKAIEICRGDEAAAWRWWHSC